MLKIIRTVVISLLLIILSACTGDDPGPLKGKWLMGGAMPILVQFRSGETESLGFIEKVSYEVRGNDVLVTSKDGIAKGMTFRYTITGQNTAQTELGPLQRIE